MHVILYFLHCSLEYSCLVTMFLACLVGICRAEDISCSLGWNSKSKLQRHLTNEGHTSQNLSTSVLAPLWKLQPKHNTQCSCQRFWDILQKIHFHVLSVSSYHVRITVILSFTAVVIPVFLFHNKINWNCLGKRQHGLIMSCLEVCGNSCKAKNHYVAC